MRKFSPWHRESCASNTNLNTRIQIPVRVHRSRAIDKRRQGNEALRTHTRLVKQAIWWFCGGVPRARHFPRVFATSFLLGGTAISRANPKFAIHDTHRPATLRVRTNFEESAGSYARNTSVGLRCYFRRKRLVAFGHFDRPTRVKCGVRNTRYQK